MKRSIYDLVLDVLFMTGVGALTWLALLAFLASSSCAAPTREAAIRREATWRKQNCQSIQSVIARQQCEKDAQYYCLANDLELNCDNVGGASSL